MISLDLTEAGKQQCACLGVGVGVGVGVRGWVRLGAEGWGKRLGFETLNQSGGVGGLSHSQLPRCPWVPPLGGRASAATGVRGVLFSGPVSTRHGKGGSERLDGAREIWGDMGRCREISDPSRLMGRARCGEMWGDVGRCGET